MVLSHSNSVKFYRCHDMGWISLKFRGCVTKQVGLSTIGMGILKNVVFTVI